MSKHSILYLFDTELFITERERHLAVINKKEPMHGRYWARRLLKNLFYSINSLVEECKGKNFLLYIHYTYWLMVGVGEEQKRMAEPLVEKET
jgi:hypothetical protein